MKSDISNTITIYSRPNCSWCVKAKELLESYDKPYNEIMLGEDILIEDFRTKYPYQKTVPYLLDDKGNEIGGYDHLKVWLTRADIV